MKRHWRKILPFATDSAGAIGTFAYCDVHALPLDPSGTSAIYWRNDGREAENFYTSRIPLSTSHFTLERVDDFMDAYRRQLEGDYPQVILLVDTPITAQVGVDLEGLGTLLEAERNVPVIVVRTTANDFYDIGVQKALLALYERTIPAGSRASLRDCGIIPGTFNMLGVNLLDHVCPDFTNELYAACAAQGMHVLTRWGDQEDVESLERAPFAQFNLVASAAALKLARKMERDLGMPYVTLDALDVLDYAADGLSISYDARILVIGEQITSNLVRRLLGIMARAGKADVDVNVATFYTLDKALAQEGDVRFAEEDDVERVVLDGNYDLVIVDPSLETLMPRGYRHLVYPLVHNATSNYAHMLDYPANLLDRAWLAGVAERIARENRTSFMPHTKSEMMGAAGLRRPQRPKRS